VGAVLVATLSVAWAFTLRPASLGGPAQYVLVKGVSMLPTFETGDLVLTRPADGYGIGDVVAYRVPEGDVGAGAVVIHRIIGGSATAGYVIQGDNNDDVDEWRPTNDDILGKAWIHAPGVGRALTFLRAPVPLASLAAGFTIAFMLFPSPKHRRRSGLARALSRAGTQARPPVSSATRGAARPGRTRGHRRRPSRGSRHRRAATTRSRTTRPDSW
jgi:signal peptidase I